MARRLNGSTADKSLLERQGKTKRFQHAAGFGHHFGSDPVTGQKGYAHH
jgi:hypothetical protein